MLKKKNWVIQLDSHKENSEDFYKDDIFKIAKNAGISGFGEILGNCIGYLSNVLMTRTIGPALFGIYVLASTVLRVLGIFAVAGLNSGLIRFIALYEGRGDRARLKGVIFFGTKLVGLISLVLFLIFFSLSNIISTRIFHNFELSFALKILLISLPLTAFMNLWLGGIQGFQKIKYRVYVEKIWQPLSRLIFLIIFFIAGLKLLGALLASVFSGLIGLIMAFWYLYKIFPFNKDKIAPVYEKKELIIFSLPVTFVTFFFFITQWLSILMLGYFVPPKEVGIFGAVDRVLPLINLPLQSINTIFFPMIASLYGERALSKLEKLFKMETKWAISLSFPLFLSLCIFARPTLNIFGNAFKEGDGVLIILSAAHMIRVLVGSTGPMLMMTGHQNISLANTFFTALLTIILNYFLIPRYGIMGAAVANAISLIAINLVEVSEIYYILKMHPFRTDILKPIGAGIATSIIFISILHLEFIKVNQYNILFLIILYIMFFTLYLIFIFLLKLSKEDTLIVRLLIRKLGFITSLS